VPDNPKAVVNGVRRRVVEKGEMPVGKELRPGLYLAINDLAMFTILLPTLTKRMSRYAIVRNRVPVMASMNSLQEQKELNIRIRTPLQSTGMTLNCSHA
jgi:hypothetical protein